MENRKSRLLGLLVVAALFAALPSSAESFLKRCGIVGEHGGYWINFDENPKGNNLKFSGDDRLNHYSTTCFVKPGETARVLINPYAESKPIAGRFGAGSCDIVFTVNGAVYEGKHDDKRRGQGWKLPVKPGWNKAVIKVDAYTYNNGKAQQIGSMSQEVSFFVFVIQVERTGQLRSPFSGYPEVNSAYMMPSHDGTVYACLTCFTRPRGGGSKYALVHMDQDGSIIKIYEIHPDLSSSPVAYDSEGGLYVNVMERIVRFNPDGSFDRSIVAFVEGYEEEITGRHLKEKIYPTTVDGKKTLTPAYPELHPSASCSETAVNGKYAYLVAAKRKSSGNYDDVLCRLDLESGKIDVLTQVNVNDGPVPGPKGLMYMRSKPGNKGKSPRGTTMCDVLGFDANGRQASSFTIANGGYYLDGFDGAGCLYNGCVVSQDGLRESSNIHEGRLRHVRLSTPIRYIDLIGGQEVRENTLASQGGHWMYGGSIYCLYREDGNIGRFTSLFPGTDRVPKPQPAVVKLGKQGFFSGKDTGAKEAPAGKKPAGKPDPGDNTPADAGNAVEQIPSAIGDDWTPAQTDNTSNDSGDDSDNAAGDAAGAAAAAGGLSALAAWLMMRINGVGFRDIIDLGRTLTTGSTSQPPRVPVRELHNDGDVNENGEVWSDEDRGWIGRNLYDQEKARRVRINELNDQALHTPDAGIQEAHAKWLESKKNLERTVVEGRQKLIRKLDLLDRIAANERESDKFSYYGEVLDNFKNNVKDDMKELATDARWTMTGLAQGFDMGLKDITTAVADPENWKAVAKGSLKTALRYANPINAVSDSAKVIGKTLLVVNDVGRNIVLHPIETAKAVTGYENWKNALDYKNPISQRLGCALMGAVDTTMTFGGTILKGAELAGKAAQGIGRAAEIDRLKDGLELTHAEQVRRGAWVSGSAEAEANVQKFLKNPNDPELLKVIQSDHRAIQAVNNQPESVRSAFNKAMAERNTVADAAAKSRLETTLADEGLDLSKHEVRIRCETNPSTRIKTGADRDITYSIYDKDGRWVRDVPADKVRPIHQEEYYKAWNNDKPPANPKEAEDFSRIMRQEHVDNMGAEAYGRNPTDLNTVLRNPNGKLKDSQQVGQAMGYKTGKELGEAEHLRHAGDAKKAEEVTGYGYRQAPKQAENILEQRVTAARDAGHVVKDTPENIKFGLELMKRVEGKVPGVKLSPVEAEKIYQMKYGKPLESVAYEIGDRVEALEKLAKMPKAGPMVSAADMAKLGHIAVSGSPGKGE